MEQYAAIRFDYHEGLSKRAIARKYGVHRRKVDEALANPVPPERKIPVRVASKLEPFKAAIDEMLRADLDAPRKQHHSARRIWVRLCEEHQMTGVAESTVRRWVGIRRPEIWAEKHANLNEVMVVQEYPPGFDAQVDFGHVTVVIAGVEQVGHLFVMRLSHSGKAFHAIYPTEAQEAFLAGHVAAFERFGGVPAQIRYDNLTPAVSKVLMGRDRLENGRWRLFSSWYGINAFYCQPGVKGAHEKGWG